MQLPWNRSEAARLSAHQLRLYSLLLVSEESPELANEFISEAAGRLAIIERPRPIYPKTLIIPPPKQIPAGKPATTKIIV